MPGLYVHIPFCKQKCIYCDFLSGTNIASADRLIDCIIHEMKLNEHFFASPISTIYFGGGTPTTLSINQLKKIYNAIDETFCLSSLEEFTIEANPENLNIDFLTALKTELPVNRLSIGVQSFNNCELQWLRRTHSSENAIKAIENAQKAQFNNISIDLMFALPHSTLDLLQNSIKIAISSGIQHISAYSLMIEENSLLAKKGISPIDDDEAQKQFDTLSNSLIQAGFDQYEISNYALPGYTSRHNSSYWTREPYLGIGPAAHSFDGKTRRYNIAHTIKYCDEIEQNKYNPSVEILTREEAYNEYIFLGLRTKKGIDCEALKKEFPESWVNDTLASAATSIKAGNMTLSENHLSLTRSGIYISDTIMSDLMRV